MTKRENTIDELLDALPAEPELPRDPETKRRMRERESERAMKAALLQRGTPSPLPVLPMTSDPADRGAATVLNPAGRARRGRRVRWWTLGAVAVVAGAAVIAIVMARSHARASTPTTAIPTAVPTSTSAPTSTSTSTPTPTPTANATPTTNATSTSTETAASARAAAPRGSARAAASHGGGLGDLLTGH